MKTLLNFGGGVQSTAILLMILRDELPRPDYIVFADTMAEPVDVYKHVASCFRLCTDRGLTWVRVSAGNIMTNGLRGHVRKENYDKVPGGRSASLPYFTKNLYDGSVGMLKRQCTKEYKIEPIEKFIRRDILGLKPRQRVTSLLGKGKSKQAKRVLVQQWFGISLDEMPRMRASCDWWLSVWHPLIEGPRTYSRHDCDLYLKKHAQSFGLTYPVPKSACLVCPFHGTKSSQASWREMRDEHPEDWNRAVEFDRKIRRLGGVIGDVYLHRQCVPLDEADLSTDRDHGQLDIFADECAGMCGI